MGDTPPKKCTAFLRFHNPTRCAANAPNGSRVGVDEVADGAWHIRFCPMLLAPLVERDYIIRE